MDGYRFLGFELYSMAKQLKRKIRFLFLMHFRKSFNQKYESLPEKLLPRVGLAVNANVLKSESNLKKH
jgi:hypothetical protein